MTELFCVVVMLGEGSGDFGLTFLIAWLRKYTLSVFCTVCGGIKELPVDPSSIFKPPQSATILAKRFGPVALGWIFVISDTVSPLERLNCKSTSFSDFKLERADLSTSDDLSLPRWRVKSNSRSIGDSSSVSLAEDTEAHAVARLPLLSDELEEWPRLRLNEDSFIFTISSTKFHFRLTPFRAEGQKLVKPDELSLKVVSAAEYTMSSTAPPIWTALHRFLKAFDCG